MSGREDDEGEVPNELEDGRGAGAFGQAEITADREDVELQHPRSGSVVKARQESLRLAHFTGPLPHPRILASYEEACPGAGNRIIAMAERQAAHRQTVEIESVRGAISFTRLGMILGFSLVFATLLGGIVLLALGVPGGGIALVVTALGSMATAAIWNRREGKKKLLEAAKKEDAKKEDSKNGDPGVAR